MPLNFFETVNYKLKALTGNNPGHEIGTGFKELAEGIDKTFVGYAEGTAAARPAAKIKGRIYYATDTQVYSVDTGVAWITLLKEATGIITTALLGAESVNDAKVAKGRALINTESSYGEQVARTVGVEYEPSASRMTQVVLEIQHKGPSGAYAVTVGGIQVGAGSTGASAIFNYIVPILVPPGKKWKVAGTGTEAVFSSYMTL